VVIYAAVMMLRSAMQEKNPQPGEMNPEPAAD